ncbi:Os03g0117000 [Oryza sativa Japonica Group]|uniref:Os03g0117000 protein n=1 Tax=Oryza sativa subsp. japonica TaxID=39947 RepID=A0A0P0VSI0_ORYSJ|nr:hypothetical protein EE612_014938 [Oryza sativa]BAS81986.1 Os03g0117000 [Oryza sativa Japonica Group]
MVTLCHSVHTRASGKIGRRNAAAKVFCSTQMPPSQITIKVLWVMTLWIFFSSSTVTCSEGKIWWYIEKVVIIGATREIGRTAIVAVSKARGMELAGAIDSQCVGLDAGEINGMEEALEIPVLNDLTMVLGSIAQSRATGVVVDFSEPSTVYDNVKQAAAFGLNSVVYVPNIELDTVTELSAFCEKASMDLPSQDAIQIANNISDLGQIYNREDL